MVGVPAPYTISADFYVIASLTVKKKKNCATECTSSMNCWPKQLRQSGTCTKLINSGSLGAILGTLHHRTQQYQVHRGREQCSGVHGTPNVPKSIRGCLCVTHQISAGSRPRDRRSLGDHRSRRQPWLTWSRPPVHTSMHVRGLPLPDCVLASLLCWGNGTPCC